MTSAAPQPDDELPSLVHRAQYRHGLDTRSLAHSLNVSVATITKWLDGTGVPSPAQWDRLTGLVNGDERHVAQPALGFFASSGARREQPSPAVSPVDFDHDAGQPVLARITDGDELVTSAHASIAELQEAHVEPAATATRPPSAGMSAGKNTYTYDAHTYHTKVPPQGIAELLRHYLPDGGLVLDPFAGSGMTGVAATSIGLDCALNELSPAAAFISNRFVSTVEPARFAMAVRTIVDGLEKLRTGLYTTHCRECSSDTELLYTVWSYEVVCPECSNEFQLWDVCRSYGRTVREHKILSEFDCPHCGSHLKKSRLERTVAVPVEVAYKCCGSKQKEVTHPPSRHDLSVISNAAVDYPPVEGFFPEVELPHGVNLGQPRRHGFTTIRSLYTDRGLSVMSHLWHEIHRISDPQLAAEVAFVFTGLYRRVTRLSEFRFWGGSGNSARLNVPYIFEESNIFHVFLRKARAIQDHLETTAQTYSGRSLVHVGSATNLNWLADESVDLVFTDPPFGANINYSDMNLLWESWLGRFTDTTDEAIVNKIQGKDIGDYGRLMQRSFEEAYRVLRPGHWMLVMFMNSSAKVWESLRNAIEGAGFAMVTADVFDKQHGTFKQFVSENAAGADLVIHCLKPASVPRERRKIAPADLEHDVTEFVSGLDLERYRQSFLHVKREAELDYRRLYSEWLCRSFERGAFLDFAEFRSMVDAHVEVPHN